MIYIGVTGWGDHDSLYPSAIKSTDKLTEYAAHFPVVEVDATFYAIQPLRNMEKWVKETPASFQFVVKAYQGMTGHQRGELKAFESNKDMIDAFKESLKPMIEAGKLAMVLFQFPPWFICKKENVAYLRYCKEQMGGDIRLALEFRHQSWYSPEYRAGTLAFMKNEGWIHTIVDEPQAGEGSVPVVPVTTDKEWTLIRFHGRNRYGWNKPSDANWREVRYLYRYNKTELTEWGMRIKDLSKDTTNLVVLFNNNSGGDAADNAKELQAMLEIEYEGLAPRQLDLF